MRARLTGRGDESWRWVLRDVNFDIQPGEAVGLIGANGSGKSTLLRLLTRVMYPYAGEIRVKGRIGALIEVDAGLHPDLTGGENIYLFGSLAGLTDDEIHDRFDSIVEFAGLEEAIDRQVKHYSTGMRMRLGFSVAVAAKPDILLVDEVLAVGDSTFQAKCLTLIRTSLSEGTTVVLVSHDLYAVEAVCQRALWLHRGVVMSDGPTVSTLADYRLHIERQAEADATRGTVRLASGSVLGPDGGPPVTNGPVEVRLDLEAAEPQDARIYMGISQGTAIPIFTLRQQLKVQPGVTRVTCHIERLPLAGGEFYLWIDVLQDDGTLLMEWQPVLKFSMEGPELHSSPAGIIRLAPLYVDSDWEA